MTKKQKHPEKISENLIIVGPMPFPWKALKASLILPDVQLIFIDGGLSHLEKFKKKVPHLLKNFISIGDGDSSKKIMAIKKTTQDLSDLGFLLEYLSKKENAKNYLFAGLLGGRLDHELLNLGEIASFVKKMKRHAPLIKMDEKIHFFSSGKHSLEVHGVFSLISFEMNQIKISGKCKYQVKSWLPLTPLSSRGVSNVGSGAITLEVKKPIALIIVGEIPS